MVQELCQLPVSQHLETINALWGTGWHRHHWCIWKEQNLSAVPWQGGWLPGEGWGSLRTLHTDSWHICNGWTYSMTRNQMLHVKRMWNIALLVFVSYNLLVTVQSVKSDSYICVDKFPIWNRPENKYFEVNWMSCIAFDLFMCTVALWHTAAITGRMSCYMWHEWYKNIFPCWHGSSAQT